MTDILAGHDILGAVDPQGVSSAVNLYAALPSLHVCWATWCAIAVITTTRGRWRHLAWVYPATTTIVVLASANHFVLDVIAGLAIAVAGLITAGWRPVRPPRPPGSRSATSPAALPSPITSPESQGLLIRGGRNAF